MGTPMATPRAAPSGEQLLEDPHVQEAIWQAIQAEQATNSLRPPKRRPSISTVDSSKLRSEIDQIHGRSWQVLSAAGSWMDIGPEAQEAIREALLQGRSSCRYGRGGMEYEARLDAGKQINLQTGTARDIRLAPRDADQNSLPPAQASKPQRSCRTCTVHLDANAARCHVCGAEQQEGRDAPGKTAAEASLRRPSLRRTTSGQATQATSSQAMSELRSLELCCKLDGRKFQDPDFPPVLGGRISAWQRPQELTHHDGRPLGPKEDWQLLRGRPCAEDVRQGELGDCWFLSSLAALAEYQEGRFVKALLPEQAALSVAGIYLVRLCLGGFWREVLVDDRFPSVGGGRYHQQLAYCSTLRLQVWASIIEKAFAKACGSYEALVGGQPSEALTILTGWPCMVISFARKDFDAELMWASLCSSYSAGFLMTCSTGRGEELRSQVGLAPNHAYSLMAVHEVVAAGCQVRLLQIRNPHARCTWTGAWSQQSHDWTPELRSQLRYSADDGAGMFFMALPDFILYFDQCTICQTRGTDWCEARVAVPLPACQVPCAALALEACGSTAQCSIILAQPEERARQGYFFGHLFEPLLSIGVVVLSMKTRPTSLVAASGLKNRAAIGTDCWLKPDDEYLLVPLCLNSSSALHASAAVMSSVPVVVEERPLDQRTVAAAWAAYAKSGSKSERSTLHGTELYTRTSDGVVVLAENRSRGYMQVELTFQSETLTFSRGLCVSVDVIPPGHGQLLQVAMPSEAGTSWTISRRVSVQTMAPGPPWHQPELNPHEPFAWLHQPFPL